MNRLFTLLQFFLEQLWKFFQIPFPTTQVPIGALLFLPMIISLALALFRNLFGIGGFAQISEMQARNQKISQKRGNEMLQEHLRRMDGR